MIPPFCNNDLRERMQSLLIHVTVDKGVQFATDD